MTTLMINDLSRTEELDRSAMAGVRGGFYFGYYPSFVDASNTFVSKIDAHQSNQLLQDIGTNVGNNVAAFDKFKPEVFVTGSQYATNNINVGH